MRVAETTLVKSGMVTQKVVDWVVNIYKKDYTEVI